MDVRKAYTAVSRRFAGMRVGLKSSVKGPLKFDVNYLFRIVNSRSFNLYTLS
jgi:hypothetical protein